jgi:hypothetical protein
MNMIKEMEGKLIDRIINEAKDPQDEAIKASIQEWKTMQKKLAVMEKMSKAIAARINELEAGFEEVIKGATDNKAVVDGAIIEYTQKKGNKTVKYKEVVDYTLKMVNEAQKKVLEDFIGTVTSSPEIKNVLTVVDPDLEKFLIDLKGIQGKDMVDKIEDAARAGFERLPKQVANAKKRELKEGVADNIAKVVKNLVSRFKTVFKNVFKSLSASEKAAKAFAAAVKADPLKEGEDAPTEAAVVEAVGINKGIRSIVASIKAIDMESDNDSLDVFGLREIMVALKSKWAEPGVPGSDESSDAKMVVKVTGIMEEMIKLLPKPEVTESKGIFESFSALSKLDAKDLEEMNMEMPANGAALMANYKGGDRDTILALGVDPDEKKIRVAIDSPSHGSKHVKYFEDTPQGYKQAVSYANDLRMKKVNLS